MLRQPAIRRFLPLVKLLVSASLAWWLYRSVDVRQVLSTLAALQPGLLVLIYALFLFNTCLSSLKWRLFLAADDIHLPLGTLVVSYLVATFFNLFLPSSIGGDVYRVYDISRFSARPAHSLAAVFADRLTGFLALVTLGLVFSLTGYRQLPDRHIVFLPLAVCLSLLLLVAALYQQRALRYLLHITGLNRLTRLASFLDKFLGSFAAYRRKPGTLVVVMGISLLFQTVAVLCIYLIARALHIEIPLLYFFIFVPLITLMEALPVSIYGIGVREAVYVFFFAQVGAPRAQALSMALAYVIITLVYALLGGVLFVLRPLSRKNALPAEAQTPT